MSKFGARPTKQQGLAFPPPPLGIFPKFSAQIGLCSLLPCGYKPATLYNFGQHHGGLILRTIFLLSTCICFMFPFEEKLHKPCWSLTVHNYERISNHLANMPESPFPDRQN